MADWVGDDVLGGQVSLMTSGSLCGECSCHWGMDERKAFRKMGAKACADGQEDVEVE